MAGIVYHAVPKTPLSTASPTGLGQVLARSIDVTAYREIIALVRVHQFVPANSETSMNIDIVAEAHTDEDDLADFSRYSNPVATVNFSVDNNLSILGTPPLLLLTSAAVPFGYAVSVVATVFGTGGNNGSVTISVDLVAKA